jgi:hypothetical protein
MTTKEDKRDRERDHEYDSSRDRDSKRDNNREYDSSHDRDYKPQRVSYFLEHIHRDHGDWRNHDRDNRDHRDHRASNNYPRVRCCYPHMELICDGKCDQSHDPQYYRYIQSMCKWRDTCSNLFCPYDHPDPHRTRLVKVGMVKDIMVKANIIVQGRKREVEIQAQIDKLTDQSKKYELMINELQLKLNLAEYMIQYQQWMIQSMGMQAASPSAPTK